MSIFGLFGGGKNDATIEEYLKAGAIVIDVRTVAEYEEGHVHGSKHILLNTIPGKVKEIKAFDPQQ